MSASAQHSAFSTQTELPFALVEFHGELTLSTHTCAQRLGCTPRHIVELIDSGHLAAINIGQGRQKACWRITPEAFRDFVIRSMSAPFAQSPLRHLPTQALIRLHRDLSTHLRAKGVALK